MTTKQALTGTVNILYFKHIYHVLFKVVFD